MRGRSNIKSVRKLDTKNDGKERKREGLIKRIINAVKKKGGEERRRKIKNKTEEQLYDVRGRNGIVGIVKKR